MKNKTDLRYTYFVMGKQIWGIFILWQMNSSKHRVALTMPLPLLYLHVLYVWYIQIARIPLLGKTTNSRGFAKFIQLVLVFRSLPIILIYCLVNSSIFTFYNDTLYQRPVWITCQLSTWIRNFINLNEYNKYMYPYFYNDTSYLSCPRAE